jgi:hypothetical protein
MVKWHRARHGRKVKGQGTKCRIEVARNSARSQDAFQCEFSSSRICGSSKCLPIGIIRELFTAQT